VTKPNVVIGEIFDWDIPNYDSDHDSSANESRWYGPHELIYQFSCFQDECDTLQPAHRNGGAAPSFENPFFLNYLTLENDIYVSPDGPYGSDAPLPDSAIYDLMSELEGPVTAVLDSCENLFTLVTFDEYDLLPWDTFCVTIIITTSKNDSGGIGLNANIDMANEFIRDYAEISCWGWHECECIPGDANGDGQVNVGDAVYVISYVFIGGPPPQPTDPCSGDGNCDGQCNVGDAVYIIAYVFNSGPPPCSMGTWVSLYGPCDK
jgi:hypothetical protein